MRIVTAAEMQRMDRETIETIGIPGRVLMENAGRGATRCFLEQIFPMNPGKVAVIAGRGNNGGDGFVMARYLAQRDIKVVVYLLSTQDRVQGDALANLKLLPQLGIPLIEIPDESHWSDQQSAMASFSCWIDAIFGTGLNAEVRGFYRKIIEFINSLQKPVFAVDIPSGLHADTGQPCGTAIQATATATFGYAKNGHVLYPGVSFCGAVDVIDIGIPHAVTQNIPSQQILVTGTQVLDRLPTRQAQAHKGHTGHLLIVAGATGKTGAAAMAAASALRIGAGLVTLAVPQTLNPILETQLIEAMTLPLPDGGQGILTEAAFDAVVQAAEGKRCLAIGPGVGTSQPTRQLIHRLVRESTRPMVIDADGLNILAADLTLLKARQAPTVLTPHPGEMARLTNRSVAQIQADRISAARQLSQEYQVVVVLKGARTLISDPTGHVWVNPTGNPGMACGGMGDVLTGAVAGLITQGCSAIDAALLGVFLHGLAADLLAREMPHGFLATEVMDNLPLAMEHVMRNNLEPVIRGPHL